MSMIVVRGQITSEVHHHLNQKNDEDTLDTSQVPHAPQFEGSEVTGGESSHS